MKSEIWSKIHNYSNYLISNYGNIMGLPRKGNFFKKPTLLKQQIDKYGYKVVGIVDDNGKKRLVKIHRLVALAFIPNPNNLPSINHKDENRLNNCVDNLEWCTVSYNNNYGSRLSKLKMQGKRVVQKTINDEVVNEYINSREASEKTKVARSSIICCCTRKPHYKSAGGYKWEYKEE